MIITGNTSQKLDITASSLLFVFSYIHSYLFHETAQVPKSCRYHRQKNRNFSSNCRSYILYKCMADPRKLVEQILAGDQNSFRTLIHDYQRLVSHIVFRMVSTGPDQEDVSQEVFVKVYQHLGKFRFDSKLSTWIARIAYNTCLNFLDKKKIPLYDDLVAEEQNYDPVAPELESRPDLGFEAGATGAILQKEIDRLPPVFRTVVTLYHLDQLSYVEIAEVMKMPVGTIKSHLFRARKMLKDRLLSKYQREEL